jgi:hypothetical protein
MKIEKACEYVRITGNQKRCDVCGQKIDWEEENEQRKIKQRH